MDRRLRRAHAGRRHLQRHVARHDERGNARRCADQPRPWAIGRCRRPPAWAAAWTSTRTSCARHPGRACTTAPPSPVASAEPRPCTRASRSTTASASSSRAGPPPGGDAAFNTYTAPLLTGAASPGVTSRLAGAKVNAGVRVHMGRRRRGQVEGAGPPPTASSTESRSTATSRVRIAGKWTTCQNTYNSANALWTGTAPANGNMPLTITSSIQSYNWAKANGFAAIAARITTLIPLAGNAGDARELASPGDGVSGPPQYRDGRCRQRLSGLAGRRQEAVVVSHLHEHGLQSGPLRHQQRVQRISLRRHRPAADDGAGARVELLHLRHRGRVLLRGRQAASDGVDFTVGCRRRQPW